MAVSIYYHLNAEDKSDFHMDKRIDIDGEDYYALHLDGNENDFSLFLNKEQLRKLLEILQKEIEK